MNSLSKFLTGSIQKLWDGFLNNIGVIVSAFIFAGGYVVILNTLHAFQLWVRSIPTDLVLTPAIVLLALVVVLLRVNHNQKRRLSPPERQLSKEKDLGRFVTHYGLWWKVYMDTEYIEDFPYCVCCDNKKKLVQTEWYPNEKFKCPTTGVEYGIYNEVPRKLNETRAGLYQSYFKGLGSRLRSKFQQEMHRLKTLHPDMKDPELCRKLFEMEPFCRIPAEERDAVVNRMPQPMVAYQFIESHLEKYKEYMKPQKMTDEA